jgi:hypothetical protein
MVERLLLVKILRVAAVVWAALAQALLLLA